MDLALPLVATADDRMLDDALRWCAAVGRTPEVAPELGAIALGAPEEAKTPLTGLGIAVDGADAVASVAAIRSGLISKPAGALVTLAALGAVGAGAAALAGRR